MPKGIVFNVQKGLYNVYSEGEITACKLRGKLYLKTEKQTNLIVVGDEVEFEKTFNKQGIIVNILERKSKLSRKGAGKNKKHLEQLIASNIDSAILVNSVKNPSYKKNLIDRYIIACKKGNIEPVLCFNKCDLIDSQDIQNDIEFYEKTGIKVFLTSTLNNIGIDLLSDYIKDKISVFTGSSGVGKSSLVNALEKIEVAKTHNVSNSNYKGMHTTTSSQIYMLPNGAMIVDTPGMREFGIFGSTVDEIKEMYEDIEKYSKECKFNSCTHTHEPECAVKEALENGFIDEQRLKNYLKLIQEI